MALLLTLTRDPLTERRAGRVAAALGLEHRPLGSGEGGQSPEAGGSQAGGTPHPDIPEAQRAVALVLELELPGAVEIVSSWRERWPELAIVAYLSTPQPELWTEAELAGADAVCSRGRLERVLGDCVSDRLSGARRARRLRLAPMSEFAGRLGYVGRIAQSPAGPIALYHLGGQIRAIADACPHAGAALSEGELEGDVVTCPLHGSQFRVTDGVRVRGPADSDVARYPVVVEGGVAFVELPR
jgi:nitrite reductase/ring-hydroxylating ferredoxin subunit